MGEDPASVETRTLFAFSKWTMWKTCFAKYFFKGKANSVACLEWKRGDRGMNPVTCLAGITGVCSLEINSAKEARIKQRNARGNLLDCPFVRHLERIIVRSEWRSSSAFGDNAG